MARPQTLPVPPAVAANEAQSAELPELPPFRVHFVTDHEVKNPVSLFPDFGGMMAPGMVLEVPARWRRSVVRDFERGRFTAHGRPFLVSTDLPEKTATDLAKEIEETEKKQHRGRGTSRR